jgi:hypothetical protein
MGQTAERSAMLRLKLSVLGLLAEEHLWTNAQRGRRAYHNRKQAHPPRGRLSSSLARVESPAPWQ